MSFEEKYIKCRMCAKKENIILRKIVMLLISSFCILMLLSAPIVAQEVNLIDNEQSENLMDDDQSEKCYEFNEYQVLLDEIFKYETVLKQRVFFTEQLMQEYKQLKESKKSYCDHIYSQKKLPIADLKRQGYNDTQINAIKNYDGSEEMTIKAAASVSATLSLTKFEYKKSENRTYASAQLSGKWNGVPITKMRDHIGIAITGSNARFARLGTSGRINHADGTIFHPPVTYYSMAGVVFSFGIRNADGLLMSSFTVAYDAIADGKVTVIDYGACYLHTPIGVQVTSLSIGISSDGPSFGISFIPSSNTSFMWKNTHTRTSYLK